MIIENKNDELIIRISSKDVNLEEVEQLIKTIRYKELVSKSIATDAQADEIAEEINQSWWDKNKASFIK